ncbi:hypothetical protein OIT44_02325 [Weissella ceti]|uniref:Uncharacterized protein n=1 Tax=Weissella ceti TaxID=759620 RepID=A0ABT3E3B7_9LACO|nr:hypothetical protein [Weissella ceti]MCW0952906.1 hypothetical protein [Weissella ceti]QVK11453.1 hypothetical protein KHQ31_04340 [Weissella ceti]
MELLLNLNLEDNIIYKQEIYQDNGHHITRIVTLQGGVFILDQTSVTERFQCNYHYTLSDLGITPIYTLPSDDFIDVRI